MSMNILRKSSMLASLLVVSMLMVFVVACGSDDSESSSSAAPAAPAAPKAPAAPAAAAKAAAPEAPKAAAAAAPAKRQMLLLKLPVLLLLRLQHQAVLVES